MDYNKPPLSIAQQIQKLKERGLIIENEARTARYLSFISLYRLRAYTYSYQDNTNPKRPPAWMTFETISMGSLSKIYENLKICPEKKKIARKFGLGHPKVLESWMHSLSVIRNICAHHGRLWNREIPASMKFPKNHDTIWLVNKNFPHGKMFMVLSSILFLLNIIIPNNHFKTKLNNLLTDYPDISLTQMGFPENWKNEQLWKN